MDQDDLSSGVSARRSYEDLRQQSMQRVATFAKVGAASRSSSDKPMSALQRRMAERNAQPKSPPTAAYWRPCQTSHAAGASDRPQRAKHTLGRTDVVDTTVKQRVQVRVSNSSSTVVERLFGQAALQPERGQHTFPNRNPSRYWARV